MTRIPVVIDPFTLEPSLRPEEGAYLEVIFNDNDFGTAMYDALHRLWTYVYDNNAYQAQPFGRSIEDMFKDLDRTEQLVPFLNRLFLLETFCSEVEYRTRGLHREPYKVAPYMEGKLKTIAVEDKQYSKYLQVKVKFHDDASFLQESQNGEHGWLHLATGKAGSF